MMVWVYFILTAVIIVITANQLAKFGDVIAIRTKLGGMFVGLLLLAGATSLPEVLTSISSVSQNSPNLAAGNLLGSNSFNMLLLAVLDIIGRNQRILRKAALKHALSGSLAVFMIGLVVFFLVSNIDIKLGWIGLDSLIVVLFYIGAVWLIQKENSSSSVEVEIEIPEGMMSLRKGIIGFIVTVAILVIVTPIMVTNANKIADITGLGTSFIGTTLVAMVTSLPELVTTVAAIKIGANDMAIGNLFGSNMFNMFALGFTDLFYTQGRFFSAIDPSFILIGVVGLIMTSMALIGNLARLEKRIWFIEIDVLLLITFYLISMWLIFLRA